MMNESKMISVGGWSLIVFTLLYLGVQAYLMVVHNYPALVNHPALTIQGLIPVLLTEGRLLTIVITIFALLPLLLIPGSVGAYYAFKNVNEPAMRMAVLFAFIVAMGMVLSLMQWPSFNLYIAGAYAGADEGQRGVLKAVLLAHNAYFGVYIGGVVVSICSAVWFLLTGFTMLQAKKFPVLIGWLGIVVGIYLLLAMINSFGIFPSVISDIIYHLAPLDAIWLLVYGISLLMYRGGF